MVRSQGSSGSNRRESRPSHTNYQPAPGIIRTAMQPQHPRATYNGIARARQGPQRWQAVIA